MVKNSFSLMELLVSVLIIGMIFIFSYQVFNNTATNQKNIKTVILKKDGENIKSKLIYLDILKYDKDIKINNKTDDDKDIVSMWSRHSIYGRVYSHITYKVDENKLYRIESTYQENNKIETKKDIDMLYEDVTHFKIYKNMEKKLKTIFVYIKTKNKTINFEVGKIW